MRSLIVLLLIIVLLTAVLPAAPAQAQDTRGISYIPVLQTPHGTILDKTPLYKWTVVSGATKYQYQVYKGTLKVLDRIPASSICGALYCEVSPPVILGLNAYKWHVRAYSGGVWNAWSVFMPFTVSPPDFTSNFNGASMEGWARKGGGTWSLESSDYLYSSGQTNNFTSAYKTIGQFTDFDYSAQVFKYGASPVYLAVRMGADLHYSASEWIPGYYFGYNNAGFVAIWRYSATGASTSILGGGTSPAVVGNGWNTLRVKAKGNKFWFYINGTLVHNFTDTSADRRMRGFVGISTYKSTDPANQDLFINFVDLDVLPTVQ